MAVLPCSYISHRPPLILFWKLTYIPNAKEASALNWCNPQFKKGGKKTPLKFHLVCQDFLFLFFFGALHTKKNKSRIANFRTLVFKTKLFAHTRTNLHTKLSASNFVPPLGFYSFQMHQVRLKSQTNERFQQARTISQIIIWTFFKRRR